MARALLVLVLVLAVGSAVAPASSSAQEKEKPRTRKVLPIGQKAFRHLDAAHQLIAEERYEEALAELDRLAAAKRRNAHEDALLHQTYGYVHSSREDFAKAALSFEKALATEALSPAAELDTRYNLGQLYVATGQYAKGVETLERWFRDAENPAPAAHLTLASAYLQLENRDAALRWAERGVAKSTQPRESWLQLLLSLYFERQAYAKVVEVLEQLVARFPRKVYWLQLSAAFAELGDDEKSLAALELAHRQGLLTESDELVRLAQRYLYREVPYKAAQLLSAGLASGRIESTGEHWRLLADSFINAREYEKAIAPLERAADLSGDGALYHRLAQVHAERESWEDVRRACQAALEKGGLQDAGSTRLLLGIAQLNLGQHAAARRALVGARKSEAARAAADQWLRHLDTLARAQSG